MTGSTKKKPSSSAGRRIPKPATPKRLENIALYYLRRYAASSESLRRVLMRRVVKSAHYHDTDVDEGAAVVDGIVARFQGSGLLDDDIYARGQVRGLFRRGLSTSAIRNRLVEKGVPRDIIETHLGELVGETPDADLKAAISFAKRRRDLASLARGGFDFETARKVIDAEDEDHLISILRG